MELAPEGFRPFVQQNGGLREGALDPERRAALEKVLDGVATDVESRAPSVLAGLPGRIAQAMERYGWLWNGFYVRESAEELKLAAAMGPPVCSSLESSGGLFRSGMCFDALLMNQTLVKREGASWPGYVSCDGLSGLSTVAGIVVPLRDPEGRPFGVWDLDATRDVEPGDARFFDVLFASLARFRDLGAEEMS